MTYQQKYYQQNKEKLKDRKKTSLAYAWLMEQMNQT